MAAGLYDITNEILGKGHFAVVKLARHCLTGEHVAIKIIDKAKLNKEALDQLSSEIRLWSILSEHEHPNVVKLYQCIDTRTKLYLVMEYCGGQVCDLYDHIQKKNDGNGLAEEEARSIFRQVCNAILYCHSLKIVHRDLKPENILIISSSSNQSSQNGLNGDSAASSCQAVYPGVKLIDFGFSNQWAESELFKTSCGSLAYSAPEILLGNQYQGSKVDIWALGCILYIMLYGCNPFMQFNDNETLIKILDCSFTIPEKPSVSESSISLINGLLVKEPDTRLTIEQIMKHPWLESCTEVSLADSNGQAAVAKNQHVHEHIIDQMIDQGIALPKDTIKKILKNEHSAPVEGGGGGQPKETDEVNAKSKVNDHHYIKATYQLLKDKSLRECKGLEPTISLANYNKRGNILKKANHHGNVKRLNLTDRSNAHKANLRLLKPNFVSLEVPTSNSNSFALPLARKCSIVSEEGSVTAEVSLPETATSLAEQQLSEAPENTHPPVDIFVTDSSAESNSNCNPTAAAIAPRAIPESISEFSLSQNDANRYACSKKLSHESPGHIGLHPVSSSPDFLNSAALKDSDNDDDEVLELEESLKRADQRRRSNEASNANCASYDLTSFTSNSLFGRYRDFPKLTKGKKLNNVRVAKSSANQSPVNTGKSASVRVQCIIQSKSLNNIALAEQSSEAKLATSMSSVSIKPPPKTTDKTDCCSVS